MGNSYGSPEEAAERKKNKNINKQLLKDSKLESNKIKLLLLGAGESGKSTLVKQMRNLYGKKAKDSPEENKIQTFAVYSTIFQNDSLKAAKDAIIEKSSGTHGSFTDANLMDKKTKEMLIRLWNDEGVRQTWEKYRSNIQAQASLEYFMDDAERVLGDSYVVTEDDWLRARVRTTGVLTEEFTVDRVTFNVWDVGGQRNERKKWIHCFSGVTSVIFVVAINEYDEKLFEDNRVNRMVEALNLFDEHCNHELFTETGMILFFNKSDLYTEKLLKNVPIRYVDPSNSSNSRWEDFEGPECPKGAKKNSVEFEEAYDAGIQYFTQRFCNLNQHPSTKEIYVHVTCAMDKKNIDVVFGACRDIILRQVLSEQGFVKE